MGGGNGRLSWNFGGWRGGRRRRGRILADGDLDRREIQLPIFRAAGRDLGCATTGAERGRPGGRFEVRWFSRFGSSSAFTSANARPPGLIAGCGPAQASLSGSKLSICRGPFFPKFGSRARRAERQRRIPEERIELPMRLSAPRCDGAPRFWRLPESETRRSGESRR